MSDDSVSKAELQTALAQLEQHILDRDGVRPLVERLDERSQQMQRDLGEIKTDLDEHRQEVRNSFVTKDEFDPVKRVVWGVITVVLVAVLGTVLAVALNNGS